MTFGLSLLQNIVYTFACINDTCVEKNLACEIFVHSIYISLYMTVPIVIILVSICRTCLITLHVKRRFHSANPEQKSFASPMLRSSKAQSGVHLQITLDDSMQPPTSASPMSSSVNSSFSVATGTHHSTLKPSLDSKTRLANYNTYLRRRRSGLDAQMVMLITINVAPFILVHIITEIAYLFDKYSDFVARSTAAKLSIVLIYLTWYFISATRFYSNCLLSRIYREEFLSRLRMLRHGCKPRIMFVDGDHHQRLPSRYYVTTGVKETDTKFIPVMNLNSAALLWIPASLFDIVQMKFIVPLLFHVVWSSSSSSSSFLMTCTMMEESGVGFSFVSDDEWIKFVNDSDEKKRFSSLGGYLRERGRRWRNTSARRGTMERSRVMLIARSWFPLTDVALQRREGQRRCCEHLGWWQDKSVTVH